jgi:hypothetical protein
MNPSEIAVSIETAASALIAGLVPVVLQLLRVKILPPLSKKGSYLLAAALSFLAVGITYFQMDKTPTLPELLMNSMAGFGICQGVYGQIEGTLKELVGDAETLP